MASKASGKAKNDKKSKKTNQPAKTELFERLNGFFENNANVLFYVLLILHALFAFLLFDFKVSIGGDDSSYISMAYRLIYEGNFPSYKGPLYPMFLSILIAIFGIKLTLLKSFSFLFILVHFYFLFKAFQKRVPAFILAFTMIIVALNAYLLYFASQTYTEAFYLMLQAIFFYYFFVHFIDKEPAGSIKKDYPVFIFLGLILFLLGLTKNIGYTAFIAVMFYFLIRLRWKNMGYTLLSFSIFYGLMRLVKSVFFDYSGSQLRSQLAGLMLKDFYDASQGQEDFAGMVQRFFENMNQYISHHFYKFFGFRDQYADDISILTILTVVLFIAGIYYAIKKRNEYQLFSGIYIGILAGIMFIILQVSWDQGRLIIIFFPILFLLLLYALYHLSFEKRFVWLKIPLLLLMIVIFFTNLNVLTERVQENKTALAKGLKGDKFQGYTPDWVNYLKMSQYAADQAPKDVMIASRKNNMSFIYGKRKFYRIGRVPTNDPDELLDQLRNANVQYVIMASLRRNPLRKTQYTINTVKRYLYYIQRKYPYVLELVHKIGTDEPAFLYRIHYENVVHVNPDYEPIEEKGN